MSDKKAMSRALGAAFLSHQVEQLEKSAASGNWRSRTPNPQPASPKRGAANHGHGGGGTTTIVAAAKPAPRKKQAGVLVIPSRDNPAPRRSMEDDKDADVVVVDASVLVHALYQVKKWCRDGRSEIVIVPLEALNTLDLLKKGTSVVAQRARAASRILEAQVGTNPRIRVQQDDAFVPWDTITFSGSEPSPGAVTPGPTDGPAPAPAAPLPVESAPEWVRRTVCCARWEAENVDSPADNDKPQPRIVCFATVASTPTPASATDGPANKHEPRATGTLVRHWAARAGVKVLPVAPSTGRNQDTNGNGTPTQGTTPIDIQPPRRPRAGTGPKRGGGGGGGFMAGKSGSLVERPAAALAMEAPGSPRIVRVLARGEKLDAAA
ncbi:hypothetical protein FB45DRAFT_899863 [Roridomyces roridus]|uniref:PIN domain-containing protein n=1 Tax=Roridomyces roridus TaxID=1738132 RepID=A0AAD7C7I0_9AGAR|nr:hypothetical protein FB45DRAFT_899863 [Roridomyces roridus]